MKNTMSAYYHVLKNLIIERCIYLFLGTIVFGILSGLFIKISVKYDEYLNTLVIFDNKMWPVYIVLSFIFVFIALTFFGFLSWQIISYIKALKNKSFYDRMDTSNSELIIMEYDAKKWLTAPKDTFHALSCKYNDKTYITELIFTNSDKYGYIFKHEMPRILLSRKYIDAYAICIFYEDKLIIVDYKTM